MGVFKDRLHARIQEFSSGGGGVQVSLTKKKVWQLFSVLSLFNRRQMVNFKEIYHFQGPEGV